MSTNIYDDFMKLASGLGNSLAAGPDALKSEFEASAKAKLESWMRDMAIVPREEFEALQARVDRLQTQLDALKNPAPKKPAPKKPAAKKPTAKK